MIGVLAAMSRVAGQQTYVDDVFSAYTYTGTASTQTITNGIDLAGEGGLVWRKRRDNIGDHSVISSAVGVTVGSGVNQASIVLKPNLTNAVAQNTSGTGGPYDITSFNSSGFSIGPDWNAPANTNTATYVSWTFRNASMFYTHSVEVKAAGVSKTVDLSTLGTVGMVRVKRTDSTGSWYIWHRSLTAGKLLVGETTAAETTLGHITVSGTTLTLVNGVIADGTYLVEAWAHDTSATGIIQCGSFTTDASGNVPATTLGFEPQFMLWRASSRVENWKVLDSMRGWTASNTMSELRPNISDAEVANTNFMQPTATGFSGGVLAASNTYIYLAIRRPNKPPTTGTQVYNAIARTGTGAAATVTGVGFAPDLVINEDRAGGVGFTYDRLRGASSGLKTATNVAEADFGSQVLNMDGVTYDPSSNNWNFNGSNYINWFFKRAPGVFDEVCYTGTGAAHTEAHNLGAVPELWIIKSRSLAQGWIVGGFNGVNDYLYLHTTDATLAGSNVWATPTETTFGIGTYAPTSTLFNGSGATYVAYLFATLAGISKVGSYTGNGTSQTINCGFSTGARFFLVKATSTTGSWWVYDSVRGIVSSTDFGLQLNSTAAETTSADAVDPDTSGIIVNEEATCSINANGVSYIFLALA